MAENEKTRRQQERQRLILLGKKRPDDDKAFPYTGVLLSDAIKHCVDSFDLIRPFDEDSLLKPANYKLTIGDQVAIGGEIRSLSDEAGANEIRIEPFQVAVIKTRETLNIPKFLIARWNIRVELAYKGLLWVGGPQVDAGYLGHLFCPIYNLSNKAVTLRYEDPIAVIDFVRTSDFHEGLSKNYPPLPDRILIEDYNTTELKSALYGLVERISVIEEKVDSTKSKVEQRMEDAQVRVDSFISITFTVTGLLFAAVTLFFGKPDEPNWWDPTVFWICALAIIISMVAWTNSKGGMKSFGKQWQRTLFEIFLFVLFVVAMWYFSLRTQNTVSELKIEFQNLKAKVEGMGQKQSDVPEKPSAPPTDEPKASPRKPAPRP